MMSERLPLPAIPAMTAALLLALVTSAHGAAGDQASAEMQSQQGEPLGTVALEETVNGTLLHASLQGLPEGTHAFHVHAVGSCEPPFESAGGHLNPDDASHGFRSEQGPHMGDMPNIHVPASGVLEIEVFNSRLKLDDTVFDDDGSAIVIHEGADDYETDPAGDAGSRIACGVIEQ